MERNLEHDYFTWLCEQVRSMYPPYDHYNLLLKRLYDTEFWYTIMNDENRVADGLALRNQFLDENSYHEYTVLYFTKPCSLLEVLVALAKRCDRDIMYNPYEGERTYIWFWLMIQNLSLDGMTDETFYSEYVDRRIKDFLSRSYSRNGEGSIFHVRNTHGEDLRCVELWYQMAWYMSENYF